jgi:hypothetical protein
VVGACVSADGAGAGAAYPTATETALLVATLPEASVARARRVWLPFAADAEAHA